MGDERNPAVVSTFGFVFRLVDCHDDGISPTLRDFPFVPGGRDQAVEFPEDQSVLVQTEV